MAAPSRGGIGVIAAVGDGRLILGATGGFLVGFVVAAAIVGWLSELAGDCRPPSG